MKETMVRDYVTTVETICRLHGIEPLITLTTFQSYFDSSVPSFELSDPTQAAQVDRCYQTLFSERLKERAYSLSTRAESDEIYYIHAYVILGHRPTT